MSEHLLCSGLASHDHISLLCLTCLPSSFVRHAKKLLHHREVQKENSPYILTIPFILFLTGFFHSFCLLSIVFEDACTNSEYEFLAL